MASKELRQVYSGAHVRWPVDPVLPSSSAMPT
jgi:hypothetical protein